MNKKLFKFEILGIIFVSIIGTLFHFVYDWSNESKFVALFSPVNESPWEHLKLLFFPFIIFAIITAIKFRKCKYNIAFAGYVSIVLGMWSTLSYFYTFNGALGGDNIWVNISSFFIGIIIAFTINYIIINHTIEQKMPNGSALIMIVITTIVFILFTFEPPTIPLFQDAQTLKFGIQ